MTRSEKSWWTICLGWSIVAMLMVLLSLFVGCIHTRIGPHDTPVVDGTKAPVHDGGTNG